MSESDEDVGWGHGLWQQASLVTPMAIRVAATLRVADHIAAGRDTTRALAEATAGDRDALGRLLRHLVTVGVLTGGPDRFGLTARGEALRDDHPHGVRPWLAVDGAVGRGDLSFAALLHAVRTGQPAYPQVHGRGFWADLAADPALSASFDTLMSAQAGGAVDAIVTGYDWDAVEHVVDVGGGDGTVLRALLAEFPQLRGTVVDLAGPAAAARITFADAGLDGRADVVVGDFFENLPPGADVYVLSAIVHDFDDAAASTLLRRCAEAAGTAGRVLLVEGIGADDGQPNTEMDLRMLAYTGGRERSVDDLRRLADSAGLDVTDVAPGPPRTLLELVPR